MMEARATKSAPRGLRRRSAGGIPEEMKRTVMAFAVCMIAAAVMAEPRTWTSLDGRTLDAELVGRTETTLKLKRAGDGKVFELPLDKFSEEDRAWVKASAVPIQKTVDAAKLKALTEATPAMKTQAPLPTDWPRCGEIFRKYQRAVTHIRAETVAQNIAMIRADAAKDIKTLEPLLATRLLNPPVQLPTGGWSKGGGAWGDVWAARSIIAWLNGPFNDHLAKIEALVAQ